MNRIQLVPAGPWPLKAMIPLYVYPTHLGSFWDVLEADPTNVEYVIANVDTGPGTSVDSNYTARARRAVEAELSRWSSLYTVDGYFLDRVPNVIGSEAYYAALNV